MRFLVRFLAVLFMVSVASSAFSGDFFKIPENEYQTFASGGDTNNISLDISLIKEDSYAQVLTELVPITMKVPLGWTCAIGMVKLSEVTMHAICLTSPGQDANFVIVMNNINVISRDKSLRPQSDFLKFKKAFKAACVKSTKELSIAKQSKNIEVYDYNKEIFSVVLRNIPSGGQNLSKTFTFIASPSDRYNSVYIHLLCKEDALKKYSGLLALILRDIEIAWPKKAIENPENEDPSVYLNMETDSKKHVELESVCAQMLVNGDVNSFLKLMSRDNMESYGGEAAIKNYMIEWIIPYFKDFKEFVPSQTIKPTVDNFGNKGYSIARSFLTKTGAEKHYKMYIVSERGELKIAVVVPE